jgi:nucleolar protein 56
MYARVVALIKDRKELSSDLLQQLEEVVMDSSKAQAIIDASKMSMGKFLHVNSKN